MTYEEFNQLCNSLPSTTHVIQWGNSHVWKIGGKVFAVGGWGKMDKPAFTFKTSEQNYFFLEKKPGYQPAPYLASRGMKWIQQYNCGSSEDEELTYYINESYKLVSSGLTRKKQKELGLGQFGKPST